MIDFRLTDEQQLLHDTANSMLAKECPTTLLRAVLEDPAAAAPLWDHTSHFAALSTGPSCDLVVFLDCCGYVAAPGAFFPTVALFGPLVAAAGLAVADEVVAGAVTGTVAVADAAGEWVPHADPVKHEVIDLGIVDHVAVVSPGPRVAVLDATAVQAREVETIDGTRRVYRVDGEAADGAVVNAAALAAWLERAHVALAAEMVGTARRCFDMALAYAKERFQFDHPIGAFQAIQHKLAEMSLEIERAAAAVQYAAMTIDARAPESAAAAHVAKAAAGSAARRNVEESIQIHGGIGYTWEHDLHLFLRRATASEYMLGTRGWHHDRIGALVM